jgi:hypothetical protein
VLNARDREIEDDAVVAELGDGFGADVLHDEVVVRYGEGGMLKLLVELQDLKRKTVYSEIPLLYR